MPLRTLYAGTLLTVLLAAPASAVTFTGNTVVFTGTSLTARPELAGVVIASKTYDLPTRQAEMRTWVVRETATGTLDFYYQYASTSTTTGTGLLPQIYVEGFDVGPMLDVDFRSDLGSSFNVLNSAARVDSSPVSDTSVIFGTTARIGSIQLAAGTTALPNFIHVNATEFTETGTLILPDLTIHDAFLPVFSDAVPPVPEPASVGLLGLSVAALTIRLHRRP